MKKSIFTLLMALSFVAASAQTKWTIDPAHSQVMFTVSHLVIAEVTGTFKNFDGTITASKDDFSDASISFQINVASINTDNEQRDTHLKSDDFFNAGKYPEIKFKGKEFKKVNGNQYKLTGDLTIRDKTKTVTLDVTYAGTVKDPWGNIKAGFKVKGMIDRFDYDLKWNTLTEAGGAVVGKDVELSINLELTKEK